MSLRKVFFADRLRRRHDPGIGRLYGIDNDGLMAFTDAGVENLRVLLQIH